MRIHTSLLVVAILAGQALTGAHHVLVQHATCPEHGELIEVDGRAALMAPERAAVELSIGAAETAAHHEHCGIACSRREQATLRFGQSLALPAPSALVVGEGYAPVDIIGIAVFRAAPKNSPPA